MEHHDRYELSRRIAPWNWQDDVIVLLALISIALFGMLTFGARHSAPIDLPIETANVAPTSDMQLPYSVAVALDPKNAMPASRPLRPGEQIADTPSFVDVFGSHLNTRLWFEHFSDRNNGILANDFRKEQIRVDVEGLGLYIDHKEAGSDRPHRWISGQTETRQTYGYGRYEAFMSPAKGSGLVSGFFTYTGPWYGDPQDEIDIEFLGKNTNRVEFNTFRNGRPRGHEVLELPFDASENLHLYAFEWHPDHITWFIDGVPVYRMNATDYQLPRTPQKIFVKLWTGSLRHWHGLADFEPGAGLKVGCISFQKLGDDTRQCSDLFEAETPYREAQPEFRDY